MPELFELQLRHFTKAQSIFLNPKLIYSIILSEHALKLNIWCGKTLDVSVLPWTAAIETQQIEMPYLHCVRAVTNQWRNVQKEHQLCVMSKTLPQGISPLIGNDSTGAPDSL